MRRIIILHHDGHAIVFDCRRRWRGGPGSARRHRRGGPPLGAEARLPAVGAEAQSAKAACPAKPVPRISSADAGRCLHSGRLSRHCARLLRRLFVAGVPRAGLAGGAGTARRRRLLEGDRDAWSARLRNLQAALGDLPRGRIGAGCVVQQLRCRGRQPVRGDVAVRRRHHRIGVGDRRHRAGGHRRPRPADRRAERALRPHADALQPDRLRSHRAESLLPARRAAAGAEPAARPSGHRLPGRFGRRQKRVDRRDRSAAGAGETVLHAHRARETRDRLRTARA